MTDILETIQLRMPAWVGQPLAIEWLQGGITNQNYKVTVGDTAFAVRICAPNVGIHGINRQHEYRCATAAATIGIAPAVVAFLDDLPGGHEVLITQFVQARHLTAPEIGSPALLPQVIATMRRYHNLKDFAGHFDVFHIFEQGLAFACQQNAPLPPFIEQAQAEMQRITAALRHRPPPLTACHNDLLPTNFLLDDVGKIWLLDWE
ncbi:MAG: phosphotransferase [Chloroflexota bacterium]|nr:phosphotransferase [Chloroflexota bacterium]